MELIKELLALNESNESAGGPKVGDECKVDFIGDGVDLHGKITKIEDDLAYTDINASMGSRFEPFVGDIPTRKEDGVWVFDSF